MSQAHGSLMAVGTAPGEMVSVVVQVSDKFAAGLFGRLPDAQREELMSGVRKVLETHAELLAMLTLGMLAADEPNLRPKLHHILESQLQSALAIQRMLVLGLS